MTTISHKIVSCANCKKESKQVILTSTNVSSGPDLDLRPGMMERSTMDTWVQCCPSCGYCASDLSKDSGDLSLVKTHDYQAILRNERYPELARHFLAAAALNANQDLERAAYRSLCAAWECDDHHLDELARECRMQAARFYRGLHSSKEGRDALTAGALLIDILRRSHQFEAADAECETLLSKAEGEELFKKILTQQRRYIASGDASCHKVEECTN